MLLLLLLVAVCVCVWVCAYVCARVCVCVCITITANLYQSLRVLIFIRKWLCSLPLEKSSRHGRRCDVIVRRLLVSYWYMIKWSMNPETDYLSDCLDYVLLSQTLCDVSKINQYTKSSLENYFRCLRSDILEVKVTTIWRIHKLNTKYMN